MCFRAGRLSWLVRHWRSGDCAPLVSRITAADLTRVLACPKFQLSSSDRIELLSDYLPFCELVDSVQACEVLYRDPRDQPFLDLAQSGQADILVSGDQDLLVLAGQTKFAIETPESYRQRLAAV